MKRIRITFNTKPKLLHSLTHEILIPEDLSPDEYDWFIYQKLNLELIESRTIDGEILEVDQILLMTDLENFGTVD